MGTIRLGEVDGCWLLVAPAIGLEVDPPVDADNTFRAEELQLLVSQVRRWCPVSAQYPVPGVGLVGKLGEHEAGEPGRTGPGAGSDVAVGGNPAGRNAGDDLEHPLGQIHIHVHE